MGHHQYNVIVTWKGNKGDGTKSYRTYDRHHVISVPGKADVHCSSDPNFLGDHTKYNPEELLVSSLSGCHMLWYLHLCSENGINVIAYEDHAQGMMIEEAKGGHFTQVLLKPIITLEDMRNIDKARELHVEAHKRCFIANSCNFPITHEPQFKVGDQSKLIQ